MLLDKARTTGGATGTRFFDAPPAFTPRAEAVCPPPPPPLAFWLREDEDEEEVEDRFLVD